MNENRYKETFKAVSPSEEAVERIYEITSDKKKFSYKKVIRRVAAAAMAFALVIGGGFCTDYIIEKQSTSSIFNSDQLSVLVAYASEKGLVELKNAYKFQDFFYRIYVIDYTSGEEILKKAETEYYQQLQEQRDKMNKIGEQGYGASSSGLHCSIIDTNNPYKKTGMLHVLINGGMVLNINNFTDIKDITFENTSKYGIIHFEYAGEGLPADLEEEEIAVFSEELNAHPEISPWHPECLEGHKFSITGEKLQWSLDSGCMEHGVGKNAANYGYEFYWDITNEVVQELDNDVHFDLSQIQDTITITVKYLDDTTASTSIHISCDKDGYMHLSTEQ